ncbi:hypothetical protein Shal_4197 [Shewanella halifaxensis HAW-EB4]|uniref:Putative DNA-binding domain-containing protein n=1 Tax=Shewanella halifaxensis (strain HAW-EB4) TaxID=458817 RepID=B0TNK5_SHEHH|nr:DNA-binding domain-containing protein [Shewanella halifaxensis]ABZ78737.1 hypothetical protein Shal_4197 [Shewanella halifaxensis HAW-EB4]
MRLAQWQSAFIHALEPHGSGDSLAQLVNEREQDRVEIYRNNAFQALLSALQLVFPVCQAVVGEICFTQLVRGYGQKHPLIDSHLNSYGQHFPQWLAQEVSQHAAFKELLYLPELAQLEWLLNQSYYAMDLDRFMQPPNCTLEQLAKLSEQAQLQAVLLLRPDLALLSCHYPVQEVWNRHNAQQELTEQMGSGTSYLLIHRERFKAQFSVIDATRMQLLNGLSAGQTLMQIADSEQDLNLLGELIERQWICGFRLAVEAD